jgi:hypothetical protein
MTIKLNPLMLDALGKAIAASGGVPHNATPRQRRDALRRAVAAGAWDMSAFYRADMTDDHIDTALRLACNPDASGGAA